MAAEPERYVAAGGVIVNNDQLLVLLWRARGEVRLPKGHVEEGETVREAALREAREETGYRDLRIVRDLGSQRVRFRNQKRRVDRQERYFLMELGSDPSLTAGRGEEKFKPVWLTPEQALEALTFEAEREWVRRAYQLDHQSEASCAFGRPGGGEGDA